MSQSAIIMLIISMVLLWGGLLWSAIHMIKNPDDINEE